MRFLSAGSFCAFVVSLGIAPLACADVTCPRCLGGATVGCVSCVSWGQPLWKGRCAGCQGPYVWSRPARCSRCGGTGICPRCRGRGEACKLCAGRGRVSNLVATQYGKAFGRKTAASNAAGMKRLAFLQGSWRGEGTEGPRRYTTRFSWRRCAGGSFFKLSEKVDYQDGGVA